MCLLLPLFWVSPPRPFPFPRRRLRAGLELRASARGAHGAHVARANRAELTSDLVVTLRTNRQNLAATDAEIEDDRKVAIFCYLRTQRGSDAPDRKVECKSKKIDNPIL